MISRDGHDLDAETQAELRAICVSIVERAWHAAAWSARESDDEFETAHFRGGFDATENEFCFSFYHRDSKEYWFQFFLADAQKLASSLNVTLHFREPS